MHDRQSGDGSTPTSCGGRRWRLIDQDDQRESRVLGVALLGAVLGDQL